MEKIKYEYKIIYESEQELNRLGAEGWNVVGTISTTGYGANKIILGRRAN